MIAYSRYLIVRMQNWNTVKRQLKDSKQIFIKDGTKRPKNKSEESWYAFTNAVQSSFIQKLMFEVDQRSPAVHLKLVWRACGDHM